MYPYDPFGTTSYFNMIFGIIFSVVIIPIIVGVVIIILVIWQIKKIDETPKIMDENRAITTPYTSTAARRTSQPPESTSTNSYNSNSQFCPSCGSKIKEEDAFCTICGKYLKE
ncbi:MAG: zinc ribbon domain-containing protein [Candidatus Lokiarchaeota archaeon]|nr:zinc ribbon domain-containing protein [Candidatus Lokiarchaeota archaeon]